MAAINAPINDITQGIQAMLREALEYVKDGIDENMEKFDRNASNASVDSLQIKLNGAIEGWIESDDKSWWVMERGRKKGEAPRGFTGIILQWMWDKRIETGDIHEDRRIAGAIAHSIIQNGTCLHRASSGKTGSGNAGHTAPGFDDIFTSRINTATKNLANKVAWFAGLQIDRIFQEEQKIK